MGILLINASPVPRSRSGALLAAARQKLSALGHSPRQLCVADLPSASLLTHAQQEGAIRLAVKSVAQADALVLAAPVVKAAFSGVLKLFLDVLEADALQGKTVLLLATGVQAGQAQAQALDLSMAPVLQSLGAEQFVPGVYAPDHQVTLLPEGASYVLHDSLQQRLDRALAGLVHSLTAPSTWWPVASARSALHCGAISASFAAASERTVGYSAYGA